MRERARGNKEREKVLDFKNRKGRREKGVMREILRKE